MADAWVAESYPSDYELKKLSNDLFKTAVDARARYELGYIPEDDANAQYAGQEYFGEIRIEDPHVGSYVVRLDEDGCYLGTTAQWAALRQEFDWVKTFADDRLDPNPGNFNPMIMDMGATAERLWDWHNQRTAEEGVFEEVSRALGTWDGTSATLFFGQFWAPMRPIFQDQSYFAVLLTHSLIAYRDIFVEHRRSLEKLLTSARDAVDAVGMVTGASFTVPLSVIAAVATITAGALAMPATGGASISAAGAGVSTIVAGISALPGLGIEVGSPKLSDMGADTIHGVLGDLIDAAIELRDDIATQEDAITNTLAGYENVLANRIDDSYQEDSSENRMVLMFPRPELADEAPAVAEQLDLDMT
ncbi:hypothetical protein FB566_3694 [Stackebrandtia endophytica]|uniref:Uncharacterized protein n=1 Tax=Stackebrandtia endophytica TaxID=1496996 RepID=A0A543AZV8_9ACTN|nr:hypothetical protein [Stackebrandtia endophytica]TQL78117.1 hypothetical protein FB566_3694 [Stackebrandtia endophytica]